MSRLNTQLQGFDTLVAITQRAINTQFAGLKRLKVIKDDLKIQLPRHLGTLTAKVLAPTVKINTGDARRIVFILNLASGVFSTFDDDNNPVEVRFEKGSIGFRVNLKRENVDPNEVPPEVIAVIKKADIAPGMFSMRKLLMDFQNANLAEYDLASSSLPETLMSDPLFTAGLTGYFKQLHKDGANILGYAVQVTNPNDVNPECPSFAPTDLDFATHLYAEDGTNNLNPDLDTLNYLLMTEHRNFPVNVLPIGNFVDIPGVDGTMAIAKSIFVDQFLLPKLAAATTLTTTLEKTGDRSIVLRTSTGSAAFTPTADGWTFSSSNSITLPSHEGAGESFPSDLYWQMDHSCKVTIAAGSNVISVNGQCTYYNSVECWAGIKYHAISEKVWFSATLPWSITIALDAVENNGGIHATVVSNIPPEPNQDQGGNWLGKLENVINKDAIVNQMKNVANTLSSVISHADMANQLNRAFTKQNAFIFPGGQAYFFKDLMFNNERDLLATITIKFY